MAANGEYWSVSRVGRSELVVKGSRFLGQAFPVESEEEAEDKIRAVCDYYADATHNCYAYRVGHGPHVVYRFDDAGEPAGTAGRPILQAIEAKNLTNVAVVVTRYFGGVKLGAGGLVRAYAAAASAALDNAAPVKQHVTCEVMVAVPYSFFSTAEQILRQYGARIQNTEFSDRVVFLVALPVTRRDEILRRLADATAGKARVLG